MQATEILETVMLAFAKCNSIRELVDTFNHKIRFFFKITKAAVYLKEGSSRHLRLIGDNPDALPTILVNYDELNRLFDRHNLPVRPSAEKELAVFDKAGVDLVFPLISRNNLTGIFLYGHTSDAGLNTHQGKIILVLTYHFAIAMEQLEQIKLIKELNLGLEMKVEERTYDLKKANRQLKQAMEDLEKMQLHLIHTEKIITMGQMVAGLIHEINNPLNYIINNLDHLRDYMSILLELDNLIAADQQQLPDPIKSNYERFSRENDLAFLRNDHGILIDAVINGTQRIKDMIDNLRQFSRLDKPKAEYFVLEKSIDDTAELFHSQMKNKIDLKRHYHYNKKVYGSPVQINHVFMNLFTNAIQAMGEQGQITITTNPCKEQPEYVEVRFTDSGKGIPKSIQNKIFEPFFTTKSGDQGTGLGLSIVQKIINEHNGKIRIDSEENKGSTFIIYLPVSKQKDVYSESDILADNFGF
jgi:signal transduction histidine kinase